MIYDSTFLERYDSGNWRGVGAQPEMVLNLEGSSSPILVLEVENVIALNKVVAEWREHVEARTFFRGQRKLYNELPIAGAFRELVSKEEKWPDLMEKMALSIGREGSSTKEFYDDALTRKDRVEPFINGRKDLPLYALEGMFQQYLGGTRWVDVVDNLHVALWMATRDYQSSKKWEGDSRNFPRVSVGERKYTEGKMKDNFAYILLMSSHGMEKSFPGLLTSPCGDKILDLREALPARFLRPHAQHAMLFQHGSMDGNSESKVVAVRVPLDVALEMIGTGGLLEVSSFFPSRNYDGGFAALLSLVETRFNEEASPAFQVLPENRPQIYI